MGPYIISDTELLTAARQRRGDPGQRQGLRRAMRRAGQYYSRCGATDTWRKGAAVMATTNLKPGTAIATFNDAGKYTSAVSDNADAYSVIM